MTPSQRLADRYELGDILGFGGMSEVHLADDRGSHLRFRREARNAASLNHPTIIAVYDNGVTETATGPLPHIVMEYVDGRNLPDIVHAARRSPGGPPAQKH